MANNRLTGSQPDLKDKAVPTEKGANNIAVDETGIPILEDIVTPETDVAPEKQALEKKAATAPKRGLSLPNNEILVKALRNQLRAQVKKDLEDIARDVAAQAVSSVTPELEQKIRTQIARILEQNLDAMIKKAISEIPKRK